LTGSIPANIAHVRERIAQACARAGRSPAEITLVAVTKTVPVEYIRIAVECGITHFGENRVQEAAAKIPQLPADLTWHLIGTLQTNKAKKAVSLFSLIHVVDRPTLVDALARHMDSRHPVPVLMQVNVAGEASKHGVGLDEAISLARQISHAGLRLTGLMTIAPLVAQAEEVRPVFRTLRQLARQISELGLAGVEMRYLSMGMSGDYEVAIEEGANLIRVGTAIFGSRPSVTGEGGREL
jgi:pyridoxal phosphate enzyme (YggS family)